MKTTIEPNTNLKFNVITQDVTCGIRKDACQCVLAQALARQISNCTAVKVLPSVTYLYFVDGPKERYLTPKSLRKALLHWDNTGDWLLPEGDYELLAVTKSQNGITTRPTVAVLLSVGCVQGVSKADALAALHYSKATVAKIEKLVGQKIKPKGNYAPRVQQAVDVRARVSGVRALRALQAIV